MRLFAQRYAALLRKGALRHSHRMASQIQNTGPPSQRTAVCSKRATVACQSLRPSLEAFTNYLVERPRLGIVAAADASSGRYLQ